MSFITTWYHTDLPKTVINELVSDLEKFDKSAEQSKLHGNEVDEVIRNSNNAWIPTTHWIGGWLWHYIQRTNRENFCYDLTAIDGESLQYTQYGPGQFYRWHTDASIEIMYKPKLIHGSGMNMAEDQVNLSGEYIRKLSFTLQLSEPEDYTGGEVQFMDNSGQTYFAPKQRGTLILFDSRAHHRVRKVKSGLRKSLVGWVVGPRWK